MLLGGKFDDWVRAILSSFVVLTLCFVVVYGQVTGHQVPDNQFTIFVSLATGVLGFYIGSSYGSKDKNKPIA